MPRYIVIVENNWIGYTEPNNSLYLIDCHSMKRAKQLAYLIDNNGCSKYVDFLPLCRVEDGSMEDPEDWVDFYKKEDNAALMTFVESLLGNVPLEKLVETIIEYDFGRTH